MMGAKINRLLCLFPGRIDLAKGPMAWAYVLRDGMGALQRTVLLCFNSLAVAEDSYDLSETVRMIEVPQHIGGRSRSFRALSFGRGAWHFTRRSIQLARSERVDAILAVDPHFLGLVAYGLAKVFRKAWMLEIVQNYDVSSRQAYGIAFKPFLFPWVERFVEHFLLSRADLVLCMYPRLATWAVSRGARRGRVVLIGTVAHEDHYREWKPEELDRASVLPNVAHRTWLLYVGRLHPVKFTQDLPRILKAAVDAGVDAHLVILGDGPQRTALVNEFEREGVAERVSILGTQSQETLARWYRMADVIVYTHGGITLIEGALSGTPLVCYRHDWHEDLIGENERGYLIPFRDTRTFGETIAKVLKTPDEAAVRSRRATEFARHEFSYERYAQVQADVYDRLARLTNSDKKA